MNLWTLSTTISILLAAGLTVAVPATSSKFSNHDAPPQLLQHHSGSRYTKHLRPYLERHVQDPEHPNPQHGYKGAPILAGTNPEIDRQNPSQLTPPETDNGAVVNYKWSFSLSHTKLASGGWVREQLVTDLPPSKDIAAAQQHLIKGAIRELHWHRVAEWGIVLNGSIIVSAVDENGYNTVFQANQWDIWYFPKGVPHSLQGVEDQNEFLLCFDDGNFEAVGTSFNIVDWLIHTPRDVLAKNFGVDQSVFDTLPTKNPYIQKGVVTNRTRQVLNETSQYLYRLPEPEEWDAVEGRGGTWKIVDKRNFPIISSLAATVVRLKPGGMRELHWNTNGDEWIYFHSGTARATVFMGTGLARTFDFLPGDTAVFPDNSGHYIENTSDQELIWVEVFKADRVADVSLSQWLAYTPPDVVADILKVDIGWVEELMKFKKKQILVCDPKVKTCYD